MARILIAPFSRGLDNGKPNPKNWPHWYALVRILEAAGHELFQAGQETDCRVCANHVGLIPQEKAILDLRAYDLCLCVDTWLQHAARAAGVPCAVIWTATDPAIFGHAGNCNVVANEPRYAKTQYARMEDIAGAEPGQFPGPTPEQVISACITALDKG